MLQPVSLIVVVVIVVVFFTLTDRASTIPSNILRGCQSRTWSQRGTKMNGTGHIMVTTRFSDQQGSKSRQKFMRLYKQRHRPTSIRFMAKKWAEHFMTKWIVAEKNKAGLRHAVVCPNVTGRTKKRISQSKRARAGSLALVD